MFILRNALTPLQEAFSSSNLGRDRGGASAVSDRSRGIGGFIFIAA